MGDGGGKLCGIFNDIYHLILFIACILIMLGALVNALAAWGWWFSWISVVLGLVMGISGAIGAWLHHDLALFISFVAGAIYFLWYILIIIISIIYLAWGSLVWGIIGLIIMVCILFLIYMCRGRKFGPPGS